MPKVTVEPSGMVLDLVDGETILAAAQRHDINWPSLCGGNAECTTCFVKVIDGIDHLPEASKAERDALMFNKRVEPGETRLACQVCPTGDVAVHKRVKRPAAPDRGEAQ